MKDKASMKYKDGRIEVLVDRENCIVFWVFKEDKTSGEIFNDGTMDIELYVDNTWLPYWETHRPTSKIPSSMLPTITKLFHKIGMRKEEYE